LKTLYNKLKNYFLIPALLIFTVTCSDKNNVSEDKLLYWSSNNTQEIEYARKIVKSWNESHPEIQIKHQPVPEGQSSEEVILASVVGQTTPDIYSNMWEGDVEAYAQAGVLIPLDTLKGFMEFLSARCDSSAIEEVRSQDGHIYQIPWKINPIMLIYNINHLKGIDFENPPRTYSEFMTACKRFTKDLDGDGYIDQWFGYSEVLVTWWQRFFDFYPLYLAASGGAPLIKNNKAAFNNKYAVEVFRFLRDIYKNNYFPRERLSARQDPFLSGVIAIRFTGPWEIAHAELYKPKGFQYNFTSIPVPDGSDNPPYTYCDPKNIVIFNTCKNPQDAWEFLKYSMTEENDLKLLEHTNQLPRRKDLLENANFESYFEKNPMMKTFARQAKHVRGTDQTPVLKEVFDLISQEYEACVIYNKKTPEQAIEDAAKAVDLLFLN
jgi:multiple sugar transport system substrate-binding protein